MSRLEAWLPMMVLTVKNGNDRLQKRNRPRRLSSNKKITKVKFHNKKKKIKTMKAVQGLGHGN